jgi:hypothetical protein
MAFLALLSRVPFAEEGLGVVTRVQFGQRPAGWHFDDLLLTLEDNATVRRLAVSVKSDQHLSVGGGIDRAIAELVWTQFEDSTAFKDSADALALAQPSATPAIETALGELHRWSRHQAPGQLDQWLQPNVGNDLKRRLVESVRFGNGRDDAQRFFRSFRVLFFDVDPPNDRSVVEAKTRCRALLRNPADAICNALWDRLCQITAEGRANAGSYDLEELLRLLTSDFKFREHPRVEQDLARLRQHSADRHLAFVRDVIGEDLRLPTDASERELSETLAKTSVVMFHGPSGSGKSVVLRRFCEAAPDSELRLYLRADLGVMNPTSIENHLGLQHPLSVVLAEGMHETMTLVIDQVDRLQTEEQIADVVEFLHSTKSLRPRLRFVFGCQTGESERVFSRIENVLDRSETGRISFQPDEEVGFALVLDRYPKLKSLAFRPELRSIFLRPMNLDLFVRRLDSLGELTDTELTSQRQFIEWFWAQYVASGSSGIATATVMRDLAVLQADTFSPQLNPQLIQDRHALDAALRAGLVAGDDSGVTFQHDLYGDWARWRIVESSRERIREFALEKSKNPLWLRALRLWSATLLETEGPDAWKGVFDLFQDKDASSWLARDALLDGLALAAGSFQYLQELRPVLFAGNGRLLRRFLSRFLFSTSTPNELLVTTLVDPRSSELTTYRSEFRVPHWYLWGPVVRFVIENGEACRKHAPLSTIQVLQPWIENIPAGVGLSKEASSLALAIGADFISEERRWHRDASDQDFSVFKSAFAALRHVPEEAEAFIRSAIGRTGEDPFPEAEERGGERFVRTDSFTMPQPSRVLGPWPDGPMANPSGRFREFVLMGGGVAEAFAYSRVFAREIVLSAMIQEPHLERTEHWFPDPERELAIVDDRVFYPPLYDRGLFSFLFRLDPDWAFEIVENIVSFATERHAERLRAAGRQDRFNIYKDGRKHPALGSGNSYGWHRDDPHCPHLVTSALMALEKELYRELDQAEARPLLDRIIDNLALAPFVGLLVTVGKYKPELFQDRLRFLHFSEDVQWLDVNLIVGGERHQMISWTGESESRIKSAVDWHGMPHRKNLLKSYAFLALNKPEGRRESKTAIARWKQLMKRASDEGRGSLQNLISIYSIENYSLEPHEDGVLIQCHPPSDVQAAADKHQKKLERSMLPLTLATRSRMVLDGQEQLDEAGALEVYRAAQELQGVGFEEDGVITRDDARCGVAAVLIVKFPHVLERDPGISQWCRDSIVRTCLKPPPPWEFDSEMSVSTNMWCHFAAEALPKLWLREPDRSDVRAAMANLIEEKHYKTTAFLAKALFEIRHESEPLYLQAVALLRSWSVETMRRHEMERKAQYPEYEPPTLTWPDYDRVRQCFLDGTISTALLPLPSPVPEPRQRAERTSWNRDRDRARPLLDTTRLSYFILNLPWQTLPELVADRKEIVSRWDELFAELIAEIQGDGDNSDEGSVHWYHTEWELFRCLGQFALGYPDSSIMKAWAPQVASVTRYAEHHAEQFLHGVMAALLAEDRPSSQRVENWLVALESYLGTRQPQKEHWVQEYGWHEWEHWLVGNDHLLRRFNWRAEHAEFVQEQERIFESWCRAMAASPRDLRSCLSFLTLPACSKIRIESCRWLYEELRETGIDEHERGLTDSMATFLSTLRPDITNVRRREPGAFAAYLELLAMLNVHNNRLAMQLMDDVATLA